MPADLRNIIEDDDFDTLMAIKDFNQFLENLKLYDNIIDAIKECLNCDSIHMEGYDIEHEGGDDWVYEDGIWHTELFCNHDWYYYMEPEGQTYGLYASLNEAQSASL